VELVADGRRVAVGELVDVEGRLGVRVTRLVG
jgi:flagellar motor switch/type III secretory pathway protein FliN